MAEATQQEVREHMETYTAFNKLVLFMILWIVLLLSSMALGLVAGIGLLATIMGVGGTPTADGKMLGSLMVHTGDPVTDHRLDAQYPSIVAGRSYSLEGLSEYSYSLVGFYEKYGVQARVAYTYRDDFLQTAIGRNSEQEYFKGYGQLDVSLAYDVTSNFTIFADAVNLNNAKEFLYSMSEDRTKEYRTTGRRVSAGVRGRF